MTAKLTQLAPDSIHVLQQLYKESCEKVDVEMRRLIAKHGIHDGDLTYIVVQGKDRFSPHEDDLMTTIVGTKANGDFFDWSREGEHVAKLPAEIKLQHCQSDAPTALNSLASILYQTQSPIYKEIIVFERELNAGINRKMEAVLHFIPLTDKEDCSASAACMIGTDRLNIKKATHENVNGGYYGYMVNHGTMPSPFKALGAIVSMINEQQVVR